MMRVPLEQIRDNPFQSRIDYAGIEELAASIHKLAGTRPDTAGLLQVPPARIVLLRDPDEPAEVVDPAAVEGGIAAALAIPGAVVQLGAGHRRARAFQHLRDEGRPEYATFPVEIGVLTDEMMADVARAENAQREDISPIEEALLFQKAAEQLGWTQAQTGERWSLSQSAVANKIRLLQLPAFARDEVHAGRLTEKAAREALTLLQIPGYRLTADDLRHRIRGDMKTSSEMREWIDKVLANKTRDLQGAGWPDGWIPDPADDDVVGACAGCEHQVTIRRRSRCMNWRCFDAKALAYRRQVGGPAKAARLYNEQSGWTWQASTPTFIRCAACDVRAGDPAVAREGWYKAMGGGYVCPNCWAAARLPTGTPEAADPPATAAPAATLPTRNAETTPRPAAATGRVVKGPPDMQPTDPPPPLAPPADILTVRILAGEDLEDRRVLLSLGRDGHGPRILRSGVYRDLPLIVGEAIVDYFPGNTAAGNGDGAPDPDPAAEPADGQLILMEV